MKKFFSALGSTLVWTGVSLWSFFVTIPILLYTLFFWWLDTSRRFQGRLAIAWGCGVTHLNPVWKVHLEGLEHFPKNQAFVVVSNHASLADIVILYCMNRHFKWLAKNSLFRIP